MTDESATLAVVVARLDDVRGDFAQLRQEVLSSRADTVARGEWRQRNDHVDSRFAAQGREIGDLRADVNGRRAPWWSVGAMVVSAAALGWAIIGPTVGG